MGYYNKDGKIKDYLQCNNMTQKQFVIGLIETEISRDRGQRAAEAEQREPADMSAGGSEAAEGSNIEEQSESDFEGVSGEDIDDDEESEDEDETEDEDCEKVEDHGMSMAM